MQAPEDAQPGEQPQARKPKLMTDAWSEVLQMRKDHTTIETVVKSANKSGGWLPCLRGCIAPRGRLPAAAWRRRSVALC